MQDSLYRKAYILNKKGKYQESLDIAKNILEFSLKNYGEDHEITADIY
jgi:pectin methylesterase-like acyl-CoA thioesterase